MNQNQKGMVFLPVLIIILILGVYGYFVYQNSQLKQRVVQSQPSPQDTVITTPPYASPTPDLKKSSFPELPVVVFEPPLQTEDYAAQKSEIQQKIVDPYIGYHKHAFGEVYLVSLLIQQQNNENIKDQYPYSLIGIMSNGGSNWESLMQTDGELDWWIPACMGPCDYSEEFVSKYPQIVSKTN